MGALGRQERSLPEWTKERPKDVPGNSAWINEIIGFNETNEEKPRISNDSGNANSTSNKENLKPIIKNYTSSHMSLDQKLGLFREEKIYSKEEELRSMKEQYSQLLKDSRNISKFSTVDDNTLA